MGQINKKNLSQETLKRVQKVPEFAFIQEQANELEVKVYLFGGTASAFAHYVRWDLEREAGDDKYQAERFDYDFTNIYRGNQDLDIVVDGTIEQAMQLQQVLKQKFPHFIGDKDAWEVRLLRKKRGDKLPLLNNYDFLNQHTDTNSTGMLTINPNEGEIVFRDLFSWEDPESQFLKDVANGEIKFLFNENHENTTRAKEGKNPPIFSAVRYLAKLAQYEVKGAPGDFELIKKIVRETNWGEVNNNSYVKHKLEEFGKKVLLNAPDSEYAWNLLEKTGLRERLIQMDGSQIQTPDSLSWWMNKEPLRSKEIGQGVGRTAGEIFKDDLNEKRELIVSHETNSFLAYENITRSSKGKANTFISRDGVAGEMAAFGDGFYTALGMQGARGTNLTIRFKLHPEAREDTDFTYDGNYIVLLNKNALTLIQENINITLIDFLKLMHTGDLSRSDKGLFEKFKRKFQRQHQEITVKETLEIHEFLITLPDDLQSDFIYEFWFSFEIAENFPKLVKKIVKQKNTSNTLKSTFLNNDWIVEKLTVFDILKLLHSIENDYDQTQIKKLLKKLTPKFTNVNLSNKELNRIKAFLLKEFKQGDQGSLIKLDFWFSLKISKQAPELIDKLIKLTLSRGEISSQNDYHSMTHELSQISEYILHGPWSNGRKRQWLEQIIRDYRFAAKSSFGGSPEIYLSLYQDRKVSNELMNVIFDLPFEYDSEESADFKRTLDDIDVSEILKDLQPIVTYFEEKGSPDSIFQYQKNLVIFSLIKSIILINSTEESKHELNTITSTAKNQIKSLLQIIVDTERYIKDPGARLSRKEKQILTQTVFNFYSKYLNIQNETVKLEVTTILKEISSSSIYDNFSDHKSVSGGWFVISAIYLAYTGLDLSVLHHDWSWYDYIGTSLATLGFSSGALVALPKAIMKARPFTKQVSKSVKAYDVKPLLCKKILN